MKILITTDWYEPAINGVVTSVINLRKELVRRGHEVRILTLSQTIHSFESDGVTYIGSVGAGAVYPGARVKTALFSSSVQDLIRWQPNIIHSQCEFSTFLIARRISKRLNIPVIHSYHTMYEDYTHYCLPNKKWGHLMAASLSRRVIRQTAGVIVPTEKVRTLLNRYGINHNIHVVPTGIDIAQFSKSPSAQRCLEIKKQLGIPHENRILLYVGRLAKEKNLEELLQYYAKCRIPEMTFLIVGDGPYRDILEHLSSELGIGDSVRFAGMIPPEHVNDYYHLGDLFISASASETQGLTYIEALSSGLPTLCRKDKCLEGVIVNGFNGWQYEDENDFFKKLASFFADTRIQKNMKINAAGLAHQIFSSETFAEKVEHIYFDVLRDFSESWEITCQKVLP
ncbi:glycosyltransferase family 4 protein [Lachnospiraceae bacterium 54-53]